MLAPAKKGGQLDCVAFHSMISPAAITIPSIHQPKYVRLQPQHKALGDEGAGHQQRAGDQALSATSDVSAANC
jgi:hypothetical protein